jgi:hypothetical protein
MHQYTYHNKRMVIEEKGKFVPSSFYLLSLILFTISLRPSEKWEIMS